MDALCKDITAGVRGTLVGFGGDCSTGCGYAPVPQKRLRARLEKVHGARVSVIGECYTSQRCSQCLHFLKKCLIVRRRHLGSEALRPLQVCRRNGSDLEQGQKCISEHHAHLSFLGCDRSAPCGIRKEYKLTHGYYKVLHSLA